MSELDKLKIAFANASIQLEIAQGQYNQIKAQLVQALNAQVAARTQEEEQANADPRE